MRKLTEQEIQELLGLIPLGEEKWYKDVRTDMEEQLRECKIQGNFPSIKESIENFLLKLPADAGMPVGILSAQSIEKYTQNSMNLFHHAGQSDSGEVSTNRLNEILNNTANPKNVVTRLYTSEKYNLVNVTVGAMIKGMYVRPFSTKGLSEEEQMYNTILFPEPKNMTHTMVIHLSKEMMYRHDVRTYDIAEVIQKVVNSVVPQVSRQDKALLLLHTNNINQLRASLHTIKKVKIKGMTGVKGSIPTEYGYRLYGGTLEEILSLPGVDVTNTINDNVREVETWFGIEAARRVLFETLNGLLGSDNGTIHPIHTHLIVDNMTFTGKVNSINRHGLTMHDNGPITKISFEESLTNMFISAIFGKRDPLKGVTATTMVKKRSRMGTGIVDAVYKF